MNPGSIRDRPIVAIAEEVDSVCLEWLARYCDCGGIESLGEADGLIVRTATRVDRALLDSAPNLRVIGRAGVGVDHIDLAACAERGITVVHTPEANTDAVVEFVFAEILDTIRARPRIESSIGATDWQRRRDDAIAPRQLNGATLGVLGFGRIGSKVGAVGSAFGMDVRYCDLLEIPSDQRLGAEPVGFEALFSIADVLSIHVDGRASNRGLIEAHALDRCKDEVVLLNTSRGFVVDASALSAFLKGHPDARAICDVHEPEPIGDENPLLGLPNAVLTPHIASATAAAKRAMSWVVRDVWRVINGENPTHEAPMDSRRSLPAQ